MNTILSNRKKKSLALLIVIVLFLIGVIIVGFLLDESRLQTNFIIKNNAPTFLHPFGTDWLGRDMLTRTLKGLTISLQVGFIASFCSTIIALCMSILSTFGTMMDRFVTWLIDLFLSVPHIIFLILIAYALGGGSKGIIIGIALTHWPHMTRILRAEMLQIKAAPYVHISKKFGRSSWWIVRNHMFPHVFSQLLIGFVLLFPHAILHEAAITFLGFGLSPQQPAIGIILSESMQYLSTGMWWLAFFPGITLLIVVRLFDVAGNTLQSLIDPHRFHQS